MEAYGQLDILYRAKIPTQRAAMTPDALLTLCSTVGKQSKVLDLNKADEWRPSETLALVMAAAARDNGAQALFVPMIVQDLECANRSATVRDANGDTVGTITSNSVACKPSDTIELRAFLFGADGTILWHAGDIANRNVTNDFESTSSKLLAKVPAHFSDAGQRAPAQAQATLTSASLPSATPAAFDVDEHLAALGPKAPKECAIVARRQCLATTGADDARAATCRAHVDAMRSVINASGKNAPALCAKMKR